MPSGRGGYMRDSLGVRLDDIALSRTGRGFRPLMQTIREGQQSCALGTISDSTGYTAGKVRWPEHVIADFAERFAATHAVQKVTWNPANEAYDAPVVLAGTPTNRRAVFVGANGTMLHYGDGTALTGDLDVRAKVSFPTWSSGPGGNMTLISRWGGAGKNSFIFQMRSGGNLSLQWSNDGTASPGLKSGTALGGIVTAGTPIWLRATMTLSTGAVAFYYSSDGTTWNAAGTVAGSGATTVFDPGSQYSFQVGAYQGGSDVLTASVYEVEVRNGIAGRSVVPRYLDVWTGFHSTTTTTFAGSPVLTLVNGAAPGMGIAYLSESTRLPKILRSDYNTLALVINNSHNDSSERGWPYMAKWDAWLTAMRTQIPSATQIVTTQNPRYAPSLFTDSHRMRRREIMAWAEKNGLTVVDAYRAFTEYTGPVSDLIDATDGTHPTDGTRGDLTKGSPRWAELMLRTMLSQAD